MPLLVAGRHRLRHKPAQVEGIAPGDEVEFGPENIVDTVPGTVPGTIKRFIA